MSLPIYKVSAIYRGGQINHYAGGASAPYPTIKARYHLSITRQASGEIIQVSIAEANVKCIAGQLHMLTPLGYEDTRLLNQDWTDWQDEEARPLLSNWLE